MKKVLLFFCLLMASVGAFAQKSYVNVVVQGSLSYSVYAHLSGDVPSSMKDSYSSSDKKTIGDILNELSKNSFEVETMTSYVTGSTEYTIYLLSKKSSNPYSSVQTVYSNNENVYEVARYNLQGLPVNENEKGIQIIVFSNYTTKTIIVE